MATRKKISGCLQYRKQRIGTSAAGSMDDNGVFTPIGKRRLAAFPQARLSSRGM